MKWRASRSRTREQEDRIWFRVERRISPRRVRKQDAKPVRPDSCGTRERLTKSNEGKAVRFVRETKTYRGVERPSSLPRAIFLGCSTLRRLLVYQGRGSRRNRRAEVVGKRRTLENGNVSINKTVIAR